MGNETRPHDWETSESESVGALSPSHCLCRYLLLLYVTQLIVADQHLPSKRAALGLAQAVSTTVFSYWEHTHWTSSQL
jgi:hypothetical protein